MNLALAPTALLIFVFVTHCAVSGQDLPGAANRPGSKQQDQTKSVQKARPVEAEEAFEKIKKLIAAGKWAAAAKRMTKKAEEEVVVEQVIAAVAMTKMDMPVPVPGLDDAIDEIDNVLTKYGLDKLDLDVSAMMKIEMSIDGDMDDDGESKKNLDQTNDRNETGNTLRDMTAKIIETVEKDGKKWEIVNDLWNAKKSSPVSMNSWSGKIVKAESDKSSSDTAYLEIEMAPASTEENESVMVQMVAPPVVIRMKKEGASWKFDGRDQKRTQQAMSKFMEKMQEQGFGGGHPPRNDF